MLFNKRFEVANFPKLFKIALITPLNKKGEKSKLENSRPISSLTNVSKNFNFFFDEIEIHIEHVMTFVKFQIENSFEKIKISDHYTEVLELVNGKKISESFQILTRNWNKLDDDQLLSELNSFLHKKFSIS